MPTRVLAKHDIDPEREECGDQEIARVIAVGDDDIAGTQGGLQAPEERHLAGVFPRAGAERPLSPHGAVAECMAALLQAVAQCRLVHRPNRVEPRLVKRRPRRTRWLQQPRHVWRARLCRQQTRRIRECA